MIEAPEFHTETLSPLSPFPLHPPESSKIPVLQNQIDPIFNMTSTHTEEPHESTTSSEDTGVDLLAAVSAGIEDEGSPSDSSSFSDAYKDQADAVEEIKPAEVVTRIDDDADSDDYAMTFDSDGEDGSGSQVISQANVEQDPNPLPASVPSSNPVSLLTSESLAIDTNIAQTTSLPNYPSTDEHPSETPTQTQIETAQPTHTYEDIASGEVDIQALLDNITANAEKNEATSALSTPTSANPSSASLPQGLSSLPAHSSLPPRPQVPLPTYPFLDEASKNRTGPPNYSKPSNTYRPPPGLNIPLIPSGAAPGTSTDTRGVLFAPPVASFRQNAPYSAGTPISPAAPFTNAPGIPNHDRQTQSMDFSEDYPDSDTRWSSDVQKKYDNFLTEERNYVTDGQWDKFPNGSRLFIGGHHLILDIMHN
jgi:nuclear polyadenylated RNA-binding protein 3